METNTVESIFAENMIHETEIKAITEDFSFIDILSEDATNPNKNNMEDK